MNERICIIGGGHSSGKLIKNLLDNNYKGEISIFSEEKYSFWFSAIALGIGAGFVIQKPEKNDEEK